jgi:hypothetical protein
MQYTKVDKLQQFKGLALSYYLSFCCKPVSFLFSSEQLLQSNVSWFFGKQFLIWSYYHLAIDSTIQSGGFFLDVHTHLIL